MPETTNNTVTMSVEELQAMIRQNAGINAVQQQTQQPLAPQSGGLFGWQQSTAPSVAVNAVDSVSIPVRVPWGDGNVTVYFNFPGSFAAPDQLNGLIQKLLDLKIPVYIYTQNKNNSGGYGKR